ncbi:S8 family serine peptidase [Sphingomonas antarctica]|uniref:S8 family serine peptidase n=1 Tax=Sphingomonas antarctica TaxID=2040274 RepID=UPI0039EAF3E3
MKTIVAATALMFSVPSLAADRPAIRSSSDLPPVRFAFSQPPSEVMATPAFLAMLPALRKEGERVLRDYDVQDTQLRGQIVIGLAAVAILDERKDDAVRLIAEYRAMQTKPQTKRLGALSTDLATVQIGVPDNRRCDVAATHMTDILAGADPAVVRDQFLSTFGALQVASVPYFAGTAVGRLDPPARQRGSLNVAQGLTLALWRVGATALPPCRAQFVAAGRAWLDAPANRPIDIWPQRQPEASAFVTAKPVVVAVWDSGYDGTLFPGQLAHDPAEPLDGRDNDGNGVADDWNGPTYDIALRPRTSSIMLPSKFLRSRMAAQMAFDKGELDLRFGFDTPEAVLFAERGRNANTSDQGDDVNAGQENGGRNHGTACASEIADEAPYVRLYNLAALPWGFGENKLPLAYDEAVVARWADAIKRSGPRMRGTDVRVVSMSWGLTADEITQQLLDLGVETDQAKAKMRGIAMQKTIADALGDLMRSSPNILFVVAAGNSNQADDIQADATEKFQLPNLMHIGATGTNGRPTSFTVFGKSVDLYAQGEAVKLRWPGDIVVHESGTSMAAPLVARAAAQMLAVKPTLTAAQVKDGLLGSASEGDQGLKLLYPKAAVAWASNH